MQCIHIPKILREGCVLQRGSHTRVWGWYEKNTEIIIDFQQQIYKTVTDEKGYFETLVKCIETGGPYVLKIFSEDGITAENRDVYIGDVFVCSGQSNMELSVSRVREMFPDEAGCVNVHQYKVEECAEFTEPLKEHKSARWTVCTGKNLEETTALGYFFGKMISQKENVPVGIINISKGGTPAEAWISKESLKNHPEFLAEKQKFEDREYRISFFGEQNIREEAWHEKLRHLNKTAKDTKWKEIQLPRYFQNEILIKLECRNGKGRITEKKPFDICFISGEMISLRGQWEYQIRVASEAAPVLQFITAKPVGMFQGMVSPCLNMTVKSILWYQGESNDGNPELYEHLLKELICDWRKNWKQKKLPFIVIQLPACNIDIRGNNAWAIIRQAQNRVQELPDVVTTVNLDLGEENDLHPLNKKEIAYRAYLASRYLLYGEDVVWQGPRLKCIQRKETEILLSFETKGEKLLLTTDGEDPGEFEAAGEDKVFHKVNATIEGINIKISSAKDDEIKVKDMKKIRYAWSDAPVKGLLKNSYGLLTAPLCVELS